MLNNAFLQKKQYHTFPYAAVDGYRLEYLTELKDDIQSSKQVSGFKVRCNKEKTQTGKDKGKINV